MFSEAWERDAAGPEAAVAESESQQKPVDNVSSFL